MHFPGFAKKWGDAQAAQATLDNLTVQHGLAQDVASGGLRDQSAGVITRASAQKWLARNADALGKTQGSATLMRLKTIAGALASTMPGAGAEAAMEALPAAAGGAPRT